jgi:hypothetical protein
MLHMQLAALALVATSLAASGCGGSSKTETATSAATPTATTSTTTDVASTTSPLPPATPVKVATGKPLTRAQLIAKADAICARTNVKVDAVSTRVDAPTSVVKKEIAQGFPRVAIYERRETNELIKLVPPASMAHDWGLIISDFHRYVEYADAAARYAEAKNLKAVVPLIKPGEKVHEHLNAVAKRAGFKYCSGIV